MKKEIKILSALNHANVTKFKEAIEGEFKTFIIMEYVDGLSLTEALKANDFNE